MKIAILGYGKMGKSIERLAKERGHEIVLKTSSSVTNEELQQAEIAIEFSLPEKAYSNIEQCFLNGVPVVSGTTGWLQNYDKAVSLCEKSGGAFIYASNFSLGVNLFFQLNENLAKLMHPHTDYQLHISETHHTQKLDAPSGTAISLAKGIIKNTEYKNWFLQKGKPNINSDIPITAIREKEVPGTHEIFYKSKQDQISIKHIAHSRDGFALGAIIAAEWLKDKKGVFSMKDVLKLTQF